MNINELYWAAGFLEGEGAFTGAKSRGSHIFAVHAFQNEIEPLHRLQRLFNGFIHPTARGFTWRASGARARGVAMTLFALMSSRRKGQIAKMLSLPWTLANRYKTTCPQGHEYSHKDSDGARKCRICMNTRRIGRLNEG